ncbi:hypothetical protein MIS45_09530 [Wielerella bovis]|uniref:hypothetical protein n=1 Tax=Wielerella bovis TaxID=2917790 RepID=UPI002019D2AE|nr:hypothetical protein [Wielerella bovis]ULJ68986.1 hypothetical protein MIS45_09530 [Wielerella bovis]
MIHLNKPQKITLAICLFLFAGIKVATIFWWQNKQNQSPSQHNHTCQVTQQGCPFLGNAIFRLHGVGGHKTPFRIQADNVPASVKQISASFSMKDMDMGFNRFDLVKQADGSWHTDNVYLPFCTAARHDWLVEWTVDGQRFQAAFQTR